MCGIAGQIGRDPRVIQGQYAAYCAMQLTLSRRGPDQRGMFISGRAALIHARLAVVDIENGLQPMQLDWQGESYTLVYNGELYNTPELRAALQNKGHSFTGHSDTEVLLHAFAQWGAGCLERCNGIFAFARLGAAGGHVVFGAGPLRGQAAVLRADRGQPAVWQRDQDPAGPPGRAAPGGRQRPGRSAACTDCP